MLRTEVFDLYCTSLSFAGEAPCHLDEHKASWFVSKSPSDCESLHEAVHFAWFVPHCSTTCWTDQKFALRYARSRFEERSERETFDASVLMERFGQAR